MLKLSNSRRARLRYLPGSYQLIEPGDHVLCAVTGAAVPLSALRYWSFELQEAYRDAEAACTRYAEAVEKGLLTR